jgi:hypothetical protein
MSINILLFFIFNNTTLNYVSQSGLLFPAINEPLNRKNSSFNLPSLLFSVLGMSKSSLTCRFLPMVYNWFFSFPFHLNSNSN